MACFKIPRKYKNSKFPRFSLVSVDLHLHVKMWWVFTNFWWELPINKSYNIFSQKKRMFRFFESNKKINSKFSWMFCMENAHIFWDICLCFIFYVFMFFDENICFFPFWISFLSFSKDKNEEMFRIKNHIRQNRVIIWMKIYLNAEILDSKLE